MWKNSFNMTVLFFVLLLFDGCVKNKSKIYIDTPVDWGQSMSDDTVKMSTVCHNLSNHDVYINYIQTPCGCTTVIPKSDTIKKNDSIQIDITYIPAYFDLGYIEKHVFVYLKFKKEPLHFLIKGRVKNKE